MAEGFRCSLLAAHTWFKTERFMYEVDHLQTDNGVSALRGGRIMRWIRVETVFLLAMQRRAIGEHWCNLWSGLRVPREILFIEGACSAFLLSRS